MDLIKKLINENIFSNSFPPQNVRRSTIFCLFAHISAWLNRRPLNSLTCTYTFNLMKYVVFVEAYEETWLEINM